MDSRLRELERKWRETECLEDRMLYSTELERAGEKKASINEAREILFENPTYRPARDHIKRANPLMWTGWLAYKQRGDGKLHVFEPTMSYSVDLKQFGISALSDIGIISRNGELYICETFFNYQSAPQPTERVIALSSRGTRTLTYDCAFEEVFGPRISNLDKIYRIVGKWEDATLIKGPRFETSAVVEGDAEFWDDQPTCFAEDQKLLTLSDVMTNYGDITVQNYFCGEESVPSRSAVLPTANGEPLNPFEGNEQHSILIPDNSRAFTVNNFVRTQKDFCRLYFDEQGTQFTETDIRVLDILRGLR